MVWCMASSDNVLIVALSTKYLTFDLSKSADWIFKKVFEYPPDIHLNALQVLFWGSIGFKRYVLLYNSM